MDKLRVEWNRGGFIPSNLIWVKLPVFNGNGKHKLEGGGVLGQTQKRNTVINGDMDSQLRVMDWFRDFFHWVCWGGLPFPKGKYGKYICINFQYKGQWTCTRLNKPLQRQIREE